MLHISAAVSGHIHNIHKSVCIVIIIAAADRVNIAHLSVQGCDSAAQIHVNALTTQSP